MSKMIQVEFEVQNKTGTRSDRITSIKEPSKYPCFILNHNYDWNDYDYYTWYSLFYVKSSEEKSFIGELKILSAESKDTNEVIPKSFQQLSEKFCSLGIDKSYYEKLRRMFSIDECNKILIALQDCAIQIERFEQYKDADGYKMSLCRDLSSERAWREAKYIINDRTLKESYSIHYLFHPKYNPDCIVPFQLKFEPNAQHYYRCSGIIGENGTGKTTLLSNLINNLINSQKEHFKGELPLFSSVMSICTTPFDSFSKVKKQNTDCAIPYYSFCANQEKEKTQAIIEESIYDIRKRRLNGQDVFPIYTGIIRKFFPEYNNYQLWNIDDDGNDETFTINKEKLSTFIERLSSGQLQLFLLITFIFRRIMFDSLLIIDEPEVHLHPKAINVLFKLLIILLNKFQSYCIVATHSPLIVREIPGKNVYLMRRINNIPEMGKIGLETLGEDISILYNEIFGYDDDLTYLSSIILKKKAKGEKYNDIVSHLTTGENKLSLNIRFLVKRIMDYEEPEQSNN